MLLIATDEAGYGPTLGPLVIVATVWRVPSQSCDRLELQRLFDCVAQATMCGQTPVVIDDSKAVFDRSTGLDSLHATVSASLRWCKQSQRTLAAAIEQIAAADLASISATPWLSINDDIELLSFEITRDVIGQWQQSQLELVDVQARVVTAGAFNQHCQRGYNKADLLSSSTLGLVERMIDRHGVKQDKVAVFCDRHGGRRYYGGVLQHVFPDFRMQIEIETRQESVYSLISDDLDCRIHFTVKGDSFTPVALSSIHAKYLRERFMEALNRFFADRHQGPHPLRQTAGYPVDAERFLAEIAPILNAESIDHGQLVRCR